MRGTYLYDDEGVKAGANMLIEKGVLKNYMTDRLYSYKEGINLTGNGRRESYRHRPIVRMTNTMIMPGSDKPEDIIKSVDKGLYVSRMGGGQVNTVTGDFVFEVTEGYTIEKGKLCDPVKNATLIGNGPKVMQEIDMVGTDIGFGIGTCGKEGQGVPVSDAQPTLRIPQITVGGR
jgi:TldD protein